MDILLYIGIGAIVLLTAIVTVIIVRSRQPKYPPMDISNMVEVLQQATVKQIRFVRNKIVVDFVDSSKLDAEQLQATGVKGIMIVGDTVKFYIDGDNDRNKQLFEQLQQELER